MQGFLLLGMFLRLCSGLMWQPNSQQAPYPDLGGPASSNIALLRRRPALDSFSVNADLFFSPKWPDPKIQFGQVAAVTVDRRGNVVVFHRGSHVWDGSSFDLNDNYLKKERGPVFDDTVLVLDPHSGSVLKSWGKDIFYMPHGLSIDHEDNLWLTDVALHQVFKFPPLANLTGNVTKPLMVLGERFVNGKDDEHFCKPTAVAVLINGDFFVSDGYCNSRVIKFSKDGSKLLSWGRNTFSAPSGLKPQPYSFFIPHALTLAEDRNLVCVADRENGRVQCFNCHNGTFAFEIASEEIGSRLFSVAYTPTKGGLFYIVNGPTINEKPVKGFVVDANTLKIVSTFQAGSAQLSNPHDIAVAPDGESVYVVQLDPHLVLKFTHKGGDDSEQPSASTSLNSNNPTSSAINPSSTLADPPNPTMKSVGEGNTSSVLPVGLNLMANSSLANALSGPMVAISSLTVIVMCLVGSGILLCLRSRRRAYPPIPNEGFNLGHLLMSSHSRRGFEQVSTEESDDDRAESDQPA